MIKLILFYLLCLIHCLIWMFVLFAFLNKSTAYINLYYLVPFVYIIHIFPFHFLEYTKELMYATSYKERVNEFLIASPFGILKTYTDIQDSLDKYCFANPIGAQGMLIFGAITSAYSLKKR